MNSHEYWEKLLKESPVGTVEKDLTKRIYEDGQNDVIDKLVGLIYQSKILSVLYDRCGFDDTVLEPELMKLDQELKELQ